MHPLESIFWIIFAGVAAYIAWSFMRMFGGGSTARRHLGTAPPRGRSASPAANTMNDGIGGGLDTGVSAAASGLSVATSESDAAAGDATSESGGESGGDFSPGGGVSGGGGGSGGW
jgi:uncharacterized membrane protein YgcG